MYRSLPICASLVRYPVRPLVIGLFLVALPAVGATSFERVPLVEVDVSGTATIATDVPFCEICDQTVQVWRNERISVFADGSVAAARTQKPFLASSPTTASFAVSPGDSGAFASLKARLRAVDFQAPRAACSAARQRIFPPNPSGTLVIETSDDGWRARTFGRRGRVDAIDVSAGKPGCGRNLRALLFAIRDYAERFAVPQVATQPLIEVVSEGTARLRDSDVAPAAPTTMAQRRSLTIFPDGRVTSLHTRSVDRPATRIATGKGRPAALAALESTLDRADLAGALGGCFVTRRNALPAPDGDEGTILEETRDRYELLIVLPSGDPRPLALPANAARPCPPPLGRAVDAILDFGDAATGGPQPPPG